MCHGSARIQIAFRLKVSIMVIFDSSNKTGIAIESDIDWKWTTKRTKAPRSPPFVSSFGALVIQFVAPKYMEPQWETAKEQLHM